LIFHRAIETRLATFRAGFAGSLTGLIFHRAAETRLATFAS